MVRVIGLDLPERRVARWFEERLAHEAGRIDETRRRWGEMEVVGLVRRLEAERVEELEAQLARLPAARRPRALERIRERAGPAASRYLEAVPYHMRARVRENLPADPVVSPAGSPAAAPPS